MSSVRSMSSFFQYRCLSESLSTSKISVMRAFLNHGKYLKGRKYSFSSNMTQKPCSEIFVTSISKMGSPAFFDFMRANQINQFNFQELCFAYNRYSALNAWNPHALFMLFYLPKADEGFISSFFNNFKFSIAGQYSLFDIIKHFVVYKNTNVPYPTQNYH